MQKSRFNLRTTAADPEVPEVVLFDDLDGFTKSIKVSVDLLEETNAFVDRHRCQWGWGKFLRGDDTLLRDAQSRHVANG